MIERYTLAALSLAITAALISPAPAKAEKIAVSDAAGLMAALSAASEGTVLVLAPGHYGTLDLYAARQPWAAFAGTVTLEAADRSNPPEFSAINLTGVRNLSFDGMVFNYTFKPGETFRAHPFAIQKCSGITISRSRFDGDLASGTDADSDGYGTGIAIAVRDSAGIAFTGNEVFNWHRGGTFGNVDGLKVEGNDIYDLRSDGLDFAAVRNAVIAGNHIHDFRRSKASSDHPDMIQFWTAGTTTPSRDVAIIGNYLDIGGGDETQSIFMRNEVVDHGKAGPEMFYRNIRIEDNLIRNGHLHGITVGESDGLAIRSNTLIQSISVRSGGNVTRVAINMKEASRNVAISRNVVPRISKLPAGTIVADNLLIQRDEPFKPNHYSDVFVNAEAAGAVTLDDLKLLPDSEAARLGLGSSLSRFDTHPATPKGYILNRIASADRKVQDLDASNVYGPEGKRDISSASFLWTFEDGSTDQGPSLRHVFPQNGSHKVSVEVKFPDGSHAVLTRTIVIADD